MILPSPGVGKFGEAYSRTAPSLFIMPPYRRQSQNHGLCQGLVRTFLW